ncbi:GAF domain-containing protein [Nocardia sp. NPDC088792]|uniref:GAF domain-containing protein n=1 Tax=Nocardia sp. NPDC088792 TaxID=3364332 RepID=UPI003811639B
MKPGWILVETLESDHMSVIGRAGEPRQRTSLERAVQDRLDTGHAPAAEATRWLERTIGETRSAPRACEVTITLKNHQQVHSRIVPITGPTESLFAVWVWLGGGQDCCTVPARTLAFCWDSDTRLAMIPSAHPGQIQSLTAPELFRFVHVPDSLSLIRTLLTPAPGAVWQGSTMLRLADRNQPAHVCMVAGPTPELASLWQGVLFETTSNATATEGSLEAAALDAMQLMAPAAYLALVDLAKMRLIRWITDPLTEVQWKGQVDQRDTPHPEDVQRIFAAAADVLAGRAQHAMVNRIRLRRRGGGWTLVDGVGAILRATTTEDGPPLALVQIQVIGHSDDPDPVPPDDLGHPGL